MAPKKKISRRYLNEERELKNVTKLLRRCLEWCRLTGESYDPSQEQYSIDPQALCNVKGKIHSGTKSTWHDKLNT
uniref:Uncharacterized protein n=1 Tax=Amphimedon queenslandica TaxID=400682 RepID=A0A1X7U2K1_AMPQE